MGGTVVRVARRDHPGARRCAMEDEVGRSTKVKAAIRQSGNHQELRRAPWKSRTASHTPEPSTFRSPGCFPVGKEIGRHPKTGLIFEEDRTVFRHPDGHNAAAEATSRFTFRNTLGCRCLRRYSRPVFSALGLAYIGTVLDMPKPGTTWPSSKLSSPRRKICVKILNAILGRAVRALFGRTSSKERTFLSGWWRRGGLAAVVVGVGSAADRRPGAGVVPIHAGSRHDHQGGVVVGLALLVQLTIGIAISERVPPPHHDAPLLKKLLSGFSLTIGWPRRSDHVRHGARDAAVVAAARTEQADVPLITEVQRYHQVAGMAVGV